MKEYGPQHEAGDADRADGECMPFPNQLPHEKRQSFYQRVCPGGNDIHEIQQTIRPLAETMRLSARNPGAEGLSPRNSPGKKAGPIRSRGSPAQVLVFWGGTVAIVVRCRPGMRRFRLFQLANRRASAENRSGFDQHRSFSSL